MSLICSLLQVPIDSCVIGAQHSAFLQQASYITGGVYLKPQQLDGLFQYLSVGDCREVRGGSGGMVLENKGSNMGKDLNIKPTQEGMDDHILLHCTKTVFATDLHSRRFLQLPKPAGVDFRASCFCHKTQLIWATYVLSVCLYFVSITRNVRPVGEWIPSPILALHI
ncbi:RNA polymerase II transcription factor B subunit 4 [Vitis vinifera]|uniref:General transcription and DNA repair factor IIH subunit TFB4 n=1 Tax=Vitis vinifera TaxID=29760 RepID=A0A438C4E3_VITVI|nr:RNA polymerase II transcription factor B subunit 4 [Vitis vinifera]